MFKKIGCFVCLIGLFFSATLYASSAKITSNDGTPIKEIIFSGGAIWFNGPPSYPVQVNEYNLTAITPFPVNITSKADFNYRYDIMNNKEPASIFTWFILIPATGGGIEVGIVVDSAGALQATLCETDPKAPLFLRACDVRVQDGVAEMNIFLQGG